MSPTGATALLAACLVAPATSNSLLAGTVFGSTARGAWDGVSIYVNVFDGDVNTYMDVIPHGFDYGSAGVDFTRPQHVTEIRFHPRFGQEGRMVGGRFVGQHSCPDKTDTWDPGWWSEGKKKTPTQVCQEWVVSDWGALKDGVEHSCAPGTWGQWACAHTCCAYTNPLETFHTIDREPAPGWTTIAVETDTTYTRLVYRAPLHSYGNVAEVEFRGFPDCPAGSYCIANSTTPTTCPAGSYCPANSKGPTTCPEGSYCTEGSESPTTCPAGSFCAEGSKSPTTCPAGSYCAANSASPTTCPAEHYCPEGAASAKLCPAGYTCEPQWRLALGGRNADGSWYYDSDKWTSAETFGTALMGEDFKTSQFAAPLRGGWGIRVHRKEKGMMEKVFEVEGQDSPPQASLLTIFGSGGFLPAQFSGVRAWKRTRSYGHALPHCNTGGFNLVRHPLASLYVLPPARIGVALNNENDCRTPDAVIGIGIGGTCAAGFHGNMFTDSDLQCTDDVFAVSVLTGASEPIKDCGLHLDGTSRLNGDACDACDSGTWASSDESDCRAVSACPENTHWVSRPATSDRDLTCSPVCGSGEFFRGEVGQVGTCEPCKKGESFYCPGGTNNVTRSQCPEGAVASVDRALAAEQCVNYSRSLNELVLRLRDLQGAQESNSAALLALKARRNERRTSEASAADY